MPEPYEPVKKKRQPTMEERRRYNQYARHAISAGEDVEDMDRWLDKQEKKKLKKGSQE